MTTGHAYAATFFVCGMSSRKLVRGCILVQNGSTYLFRVDVKSKAIAPTLGNTMLWCNFDTTQEVLMDGKCIQPPQQKAAQRERVHSSGEPKYLMALGVVVCNDWPGPGSREEKPQNSMGDSVWAPCGCSCEILRFLNAYCPKQMPNKKVFRERTFILIERQDFNLFQSRFFLMFKCRIVYGHLQNQGRALTPMENVKEWPEQPWHLESRQPLSSWLANESTTLDKSRLKAAGNIVMPPMAHLALTILAHG